MRNRIEKIQSDRSHYETVAHHTVFHEILSSNLPEREKTVERLWQEAQIFTFAGTETAAWALSVMTFYLLSMPNITQKLRAELNTAIPDAQKVPSWKKLEQLPYLSAIISEGLRLSIGVSTRQHRICPDETLVLDTGEREWIIPKGTVIAMSNPSIHFNSDIFPDPTRFDPERWIKNPGLERYLWSFSKGPRRCLGVNLAYAELYLCIAMLFRRFDVLLASDEKACSTDNHGIIELFDTTTDDVTFHQDMFGPFPKEGSKGVRVMIN
jgi:cytochrome P450